MDDNRPYCEICGLFLEEITEGLHCERCEVNLCGVDDGICAYQHVEDKHPEAISFIKSDFWVPKDE